MKLFSDAIVKERRAKWFFFLLALLGLFILITKINNMLVSFILSLVTYYLLSPVVELLERRGMSRTTATLIPFAVLSLIIFSAIGFGFPTLLTQMKSLQANYPKYALAVKNMFERLLLNVEQLGGEFVPVNFDEMLQTWGKSIASELFEKVPAYVSQSLMVLFMAPFLSFFMLVDGRNLIRKIFFLVPNSVFELCLSVNYQISAQLGGYIRARLIESIIVGLITWIGLLLIQFPYSLLLALLAALLNVIPYVGPIIGALPAFVISFANGADPKEIIGLLVIYSLGQIIDGILLVPFLVARIVDLHPVVVVLAVIVGSQLMGVIGMIISIPIVSALKVSFFAIYKHVTDFRA